MISQKLLMISITIWIFLFPVTYISFPFYLLYLFGGWDCNRDLADFWAFDIFFWEMEAVISQMAKMTKTKSKTANKYQIYQKPKNQPSKLLINSLVFLIKSGIFAISFSTFPNIFFPFLGTISVWWLGRQSRSGWFLGFWHFFWEMEAVISQHRGWRRPFPAVMSQNDFWP